MPCFLMLPQTRIPQCSLHRKLVLKDANGCFFFKKKEKEIKKKKTFHGQLSLESIGLNKVQQGNLL